MTYRVLVKVTDERFPANAPVENADLRIDVPNLRKSTILDTCFEFHFEMQQRGFGCPVYSVQCYWKLKR